MTRAADKAGAARLEGTAPGVSAHVSRIAGYLAAAKAGAEKLDALPDLGHFAIGSAEMAAAIRAPSGWAKRTSISAIGVSLVLHSGLMLALMPAVTKSSFGVGGTAFETVAVEIVSSSALESALKSLAAASTGSLGALAEQSGTAAVVPESEAEAAKPAPKPEPVTPQAEAPLQPEETARDPEQPAALVPGREARDAPDPTLAKPEPVRPTPPTETVKDDGRDTTRQVAMMPVPSGGTTALGASETPAEAAAAASQGTATRYALEVRIALGRAIGRAPPRYGNRRGKVIVGFALSETGAVVVSGIEQSSGLAVLDDAALAIVRGTRFPAPPPGMRPAQLSYTMPIEFRP